MKRILLGSVVASVVLGGSASAEDITIAVLTKNQTNPFFHGVRVGSQKAGEALGLKIVQYVPTKPDSIPEQMSQIEDVIVKKPNAIVIDPVDYKAMVPAIEKLNAAGIPVINNQDRSAGGKIVTFIGVNDYLLGKETARALFKQLDGKGNVVIIEGVKSYIVSQDRVRGFNDALKEFPDIKLVASQPGNFQRLQALQVMENLMQSHSKIDGVLAANDPMAAGVIEALEGANRKAAVIGINGTKEAIDAIGANKLVASGDAQPFLQGCLAVQIALRAIKGEPVPAEFLGKPVIIDKSNYKEFDVPPERRSCPSYEDVIKNQS